MLYHLLDPPLTVIQSITFRTTAAGLTGFSFSTEQDAEYLLARRKITRFSPPHSGSPAITREAERSSGGLEVPRPRADHSPEARTPKCWYNPRLWDALRSAAFRLASGQTSRVPDDQPNDCEIQNQRARAPGVNRQAPASDTRRIYAQTLSAPPLPALRCSLRLGVPETRTREEHSRSLRPGNTYEPNVGVISSLAFPPQRRPPRHRIDQL